MGLRVLGGEGKALLPTSFSWDLFGGFRCGTDGGNQGGERGSGTGVLSDCWLNNHIGWATSLGAFASANASARCSATREGAQLAQSTQGLCCR